MSLQGSGARRRWSVRASFALGALVFGCFGVAARDVPAPLRAAAKRAIVHEAIVAPWDTDWTQRAELTASDGAGSDFLGRSVSLDGDTVVVGAAGADIGGAESQGAVYVFVRSGDTWTQQAKLTASDGAAGDEFGFAAAISGDTIVAGARFAAIDGINGHGAVYVYVRSGDTWTEQAKFFADDGAAFDEAGFSVAIDGDTALVGSPFANGSQGKTYVFTRSGIAWSPQATLAADDGAPFDRFGLALAVLGDTAIVGSPSAAIGANGYQGAAYVYTRDAGAWDLETKLTAGDGAAFDEFGVSVALDGDTAVVGAHFADIGQISGQGAAYAFVRDAGTWSEQGKLVSDDGFFGDEFGISVAVSGDTAAIGAMFADGGGVENEGEAYIFERAGGAWSQAAKLLPDAGDLGEEFGIGIALEGDTAIVGAESAPVDGDWRGAAFVFSSASATPVPAAAVTPDSLAFALAPGTSDAQPIDIANVGDAGSTLLFSIYEAEDATCGVPVDAAWLDAAPIDGSVEAGASQAVQVTADATALDDGEYTAWLCVSTSDPAQAFVPVPVTLTVSGVNPDVIFVEGFDGR
jgi:FG-GAP repeat protein